jgi:hypothetical protein
MHAKEPDDQYSDKEAERRAREAIRRSFEMPYKPHKELVGTTQRAKKMRKFKTNDKKKRS